MSEQRNGHLSAALAELLAEESRLAKQAESVNARLAAIRDAISPIKKLVEKDSALPVTETSGVFDVFVNQTVPDLHGLSLPKAIYRVLAAERDPLSAADVARRLKRLGFKSESKNLPNVTGTALRRLKGKRFEQNAYGKWHLRGTQ